MQSTRKPLNGPGFNRKAAIREALDRMQKWFGKTLTADQLAEYGRSLRFVPAEALEEITQQVVDDTPATPGRFPTPAKLLEYYYNWRTAHPEKRAQYAKTDCPVCRSDFGLLHGAREEGGIVYRVVARCAACENWLSDFPREAVVPLLRPEDLKARGYLLEYPRKAWPIAAGHGADESAAPINP